MRRKPPDEGTRRSRSGFLFLPKGIAGEVRWLERATWIEEVCYWYGPHSGRYRGWTWESIQWTEEDE